VRLGEVIYTFLYSVPTLQRAFLLQRGRGRRTAAPFLPGTSFLFTLLPETKAGGTQLDLTSLGARVSSSLSKTLITLSLDPKISSRAVIFQRGCADCQRRRRAGVCRGWHTKPSHPRHPTARGTPLLPTSSPKNP